MHAAKDGGLWKMMSEKKEAHFPSELWRSRQKKDSAIKRELREKYKNTLALGTKGISTGNFFSRSTYTRVQFVTFYKRK